MTDDDFDKVDEDFASEFDFVDNKQSGGTGSPSGQPNGPQQPKGSSSVVTLMVIISILGGGYYAYSHFFSKKTDENPVALPGAPKQAGLPSTELPTMPEHMADSLPIQEPTTTQAPSTVAEQLGNAGELSAALPPPGEKSFEQLQRDVQSAKQAQQPASAQQAVPAEMRNALQTISEDMTENTNNIRQLEGVISNMVTTLDHLNRTISAMDNRVLALTETVDGLSEDLSNVKRVMVEQDLDLTMPGNVKVSSHSKKQTQSISSSEPNYNVHAIIPGRAWLKGANGQIITVTEGDKIGDYGTVAVIDAANGLVRTSSGIIIR